MHQEQFRQSSNTVGTFRFDIGKSNIQFHSAARYILVAGGTFSCVKLSFRVISATVAQQFLLYDLVWRIPNEMKTRIVKVLLVTGADGKKVQRSLAAPVAIWNMTEGLITKMPGNCSLGDLFEVLVNFARMLPGEFDIKPAPAVEGDAWLIAGEIARANGMVGPARLFERLVSVVALFPERFFLDRPEVSVERLLVNDGGEKYANSPSQPPSCT